MQVKLVMFKEDGERRDFPIPDSIATVGRGEDCDLQVPLVAISRRHCQIVLEDEQLILRDLGSTNGTYHNEQRVQEAVLEPGDHVRVGPVIFTVVINDQPAQIEPVRTLLEPGSEQVTGHAGHTGQAAQSNTVDEGPDTDADDDLDAPHTALDAMAGRGDSSAGGSAAGDDPLAALAALNKPGKKPKA